MLAGEQRKNKSILFVIGACLFTYTLIRAFLLCISWDEAYSYIEFVRNGRVVLDKYDMMSANNHMLNTLGMILSLKLFGLHEFVLRLPVVLGHLLFLFYSAKLVSKIEHKWIAVSAYIIMNVNPYMLDFFSIARGYGLSLGLMMPSLYYFYLFQTGSAKIKYSGISILFAALAVLANFVLLNYFVVLSGLIMLFTIYFAQNKTITGAEMIKSILKGILFPLAITISLFVFIVPILLELKNAGALYFGADNGFWQDTVSTIIDRSFYEKVYSYYWIQRAVKVFVVVSVLTGIGFVVIGIFKKKQGQNFLFLCSLVLLLILSSLSTIVQHHVLGTLYLIDRTALFLVVLFNLVFVFLADQLLLNYKKISFLTYGYAVLLAAHFFVCFNLKYTLEWKYDADTKEMLDDIAKLKKTPPGKETISIGIPLIFDPAINFYREKNQLTWLNSVWRWETTNPRQDFYCLAAKDLPEFNMDSIVILKTYPVTGNMIACPRYIPKSIETTFMKELNYKESDGFLIDESIEYAPGFSYIVNDSITPNKKAVLAFYAEVKAEDLSDDNLVMVLSMQHADGKLYSWQKAYVKDFIRNENEFFRANFTCVVPAQAREGDEIKAYIWNPDKHRLHIKKQEFKWLSYNY